MKHPTRLLRVCASLTLTAACGGPSRPGTLSDVAPTETAADVGALDAVTADGPSSDASSIDTATTDATPDAGPFVTAAHPAFPILPSNRGAELIPMRLVVIVTPSDPDAAQLFAFGDALLTSRWWTSAGSDYSLGAPAAMTSIHITGARVTASMDFDELRSYVNATLASHPEATPDGNTIYMFFFPPGTNYQDESGGQTCSDLGAHNTLETYSSYTGQHLDALAWAQRCPLPPGRAELDQLTITSSHEFMESSSDTPPPYGYALPPRQRALEGMQPPWGVTSWAYSAAEGAVENADLCHLTDYTEAGFHFQRIWSLSGAALGGDPCLPALTDPYYSASAPHDWIAIPAGTTTTIPITGWSTGPRGPWTARIAESYTSTNDFTASFAGGASTVSINNGVTATLSVTAPADPGEFAVFRVQSSENPPDTTTGVIPVPSTGDTAHQWYFGVHTVNATPVGTRPTTCGDGVCGGTAGETCGNCPDDCGPCGAQCGAVNLSVPCGSTSCPTHSTCTGGSCACDTGYLASTCNGAACPSGGCTGSDWWCAPHATCGATNFTVACASGTCPADSVCTPNNRCACAYGSTAVQCDGTACPSTGCSYPNYECTSCGPGNFTITCPDGHTCPSFSTCGTGHTCNCNSGYRDYDCAGDTCASQGGCSGYGWWCAPN